jgi:hypothetical protein
MRERPESRGSFASPALTATYVSLVRPRTHSPNPVQLRHFFGEEFHYPDRRGHFKSEFGLSLVGESLPGIDSDPGQRAQRVADGQQDKRHDQVV